MTFSRIILSSRLPKCVIISDLIQSHIKRILVGIDISNLSNSAYSVIKEPHSKNPLRMSLRLLLIVLPGERENLSILKWVTL